MGKVVVKRYNYRNIAAAMAVLLLAIVSIATACDSSDSKKKTQPTAQTSSVASKEKSTKKKDTAKQFKADKIITKNYKYESILNNVNIGKGSLILLDADNKYDGTVPDDLDGVYAYLFDKSGAQIGSTSSTLVTGRKEMLNAFNEMLCAFYDETSLKTIMVREIYTGKAPSADSEGGENDYLVEETSDTSDLTCYEHETGLAIDLQLYLSDEGTYPAFDGTGTYEWFAKNSWKYGFVLRYPEDKASVTNMGYVANHFRYVGKPHAQIMHDENLCLEEYLEFLKSYTFQKPYSIECADGSCYAVYYIEKSGENSTNIPVPMDENDNDYDYEISGDNVGGYVMTVTVVASEKVIEPSEEFSEDDSIDDENDDSLYEEDEE